MVSLKTSFLSLREKKKKKERENEESRFVFRLLLFLCWSQPGPIFFAAGIYSD